MQPHGKILIFDIETAPALGWFWGLWGQNIGINQIKDGPYMLCWSARWVGKKEIMFDSLPNYPKYFKSNPKCDLKITQSIHKLLNEAEIVVAHNGNSFDIKWVNGLFVKHNLPPINVKSVDTKVAYKQVCRLMSNKLDFISGEFFDEHKLAHSGFKLWVGCMEGDEKAWRKMERYNKKDVVLLEKAYLKIRPYMKNHPNLAVRANQSLCCPLCLSNNYKRAGYAYTKVSQFQRFQCNDCGKWFQDSKNLIKQGTIMKGC